MGGGYRPSIIAQFANSKALTLIFVAGAPAGLLFIASCFLRRAACMDGNSYIASPNVCI